MILAVDVGNHKTACALCTPDARVVRSWRLPTDRLASPEALPEDLEAGEADIVAVACVVPAALAPVREAVRRAGKPCFVLDGETFRGFPIRYNPPADLGPDRIANAAAALKLWGGPALVVDFGTATTFDVLGRDGDFAGGAIAPGLETGASALWQKAARLSSPGWRMPARALGRSTADCLLSGLLLGYAQMVDGMARLLAEEAGPFVHIAATGGLAQMAAGVCREIREVVPDLTVRGIAAAWAMHTAAGGGI